MLRPTVKLTHTYRIVPVEAEVAKA